MLERSVPVFSYDDLTSIKRKLLEVALHIFPEALGQAVAGHYTRNPILPCIPASYHLLPYSGWPQLVITRRFRRLSLHAFAKHIAKSVIFSAAILIILLRDWYFLYRGQNVLSVLYYHRVTDICRDGMTVGIETFERQIRFLKKHYRLVDPSELPDWIESEKCQKGRKGVLVTFDDGYEDNYTNALPILKKYSCPALFFISTGLIGNDRQFEHDRQLQPELYFRKMDWTQIREAEQSGITIGVHSDTHANLARIGLSEAINEIDTSVSTFERHLGAKPHFISYPFGGIKDITPQVVDYVRRQPWAHFLFSAFGNKNVSPMDRFNIRRVNISWNDDLVFVFWFKTEGGFDTLLSS